VPTSFVRRLECFVRLAESEKAMLVAAAGERVRHVDAREDIAREGDRPEAACLIMRGWAIAYKTLEDGRRQITSVFLPGDVCDLDVLVHAERDCSIGSITPVQVADLSPAAIEGLMANRRLAQALRWVAATATSIQREWTVSLGQRDATERLAHFLCEIFIRLEVTGFTEGDSCEFPLTQVDLADATGISAVHVNRTLQELRAANLIVLRDRSLTIPDLARLKGVALFDAGYLHLGHEGRHLDASE
jgi:CRP-like cAMP-binding protein